MNLIKQNFDVGNEENYKSLIEYFPENTKEGFKTEALPTIWENKEEFNNLMNDPQMTWLS